MNNTFFKKLHTANNSKARAGLLLTDRGKIETPIFMPVGTRATVKTLSPDDLTDAGTQIILGIVEFHTAEACIAPLVGKIM